MVRLPGLLISIIVTFVSQLQIRSKKIIKVGHAARGAGFFWFRCGGGGGLLRLLFLPVHLLWPRCGEMSLSQWSSTCNEDSNDWLTPLAGKVSSTWQEKITDVSWHGEGICWRVGLHGGIQRTSWRQDIRSWSHLIKWLIILLAALVSESLSLPLEELLSEDSERPWDAGALSCGRAGLGAGELDWSSVLFCLEEEDEEEDEGVVGRPLDPIWADYSSMRNIRIYPFQAHPWFVGFSLHFIRVSRFSRG